MRGARTCNAEDDANGVMISLKSEEIYLLFMHLYVNFSYKW